MSDIVERMRFWSGTRNNNPTAWNIDCGDAANEIDRLRAERAPRTAERDEARRELCIEHLSPEAEARRRGWDCFAHTNKNDVPVQDGGEG